MGHKKNPRNEANEPQFDEKCPILIYAQKNYGY